MLLNKQIKDYRKNESGHYAIMTAVLALPIIMGVSAAMDFSSAQSEYSSVKNALDNAVLAAATNNKVTLPQKEKIALLHFRQNYSGRANVTATASATGDLVEMTANGLVPFSVSEALGLEGVKIGAKSAAMRSEENVICVLALAEDLDNAIEFTGGVEFFAPNCSVQSNSKNSVGMVSSGIKKPIAKSFCSSGGLKGSFSPYAKGECLPVSDPYENINAAPIGPCISTSIFGTKSNNGKGKGGGMGQAAADALGDVAESVNTIGDNVLLRPGTYCGGLTIDGRNVEFMAGDYVMLDGPLTFKNGAEITGNDVTFGFTGKKSVLRVELGASATLKGPSKGDRKGIVFMQMDRTKVKKNSNNKFRHVITSGGKLNIIGTAYFPDEALIVSGAGTEMGAQAPATSFIAHSLIFEGEEGSRVQVKVDHQAAGLPPLLPRAEDGAILVE